jgi:hypothetical protein
LGRRIEGSTIGEVGLEELQSLKKDLRIYSWGRRIEGFTVGEVGLEEFQSLKKDLGIYS